MNSYIFNTSNNLYVVFTENKKTICPRFFKENATYL